MRYVIDTCSLLRGTRADFSALAERGSILIPAAVAYELLNQIVDGRRRSQKAAARLLSIPHSIGPEFVDINRKAFGLRPLSGAARLEANIAMLIRTAADFPQHLSEQWNLMWSRGMVAHRPGNITAWKSEMADEFRRQMNALAAVNRADARDLVAGVIDTGDARGMERPDRKTAAAMRDHIHDLLLESRWPSIRLLEYLADAVGVRNGDWSAEPDDIQGQAAFEMLSARYGYTGTLEFALTTYTYLVDRHIFGHNGHRNDFVDLIISSSIEQQGDLLVTEETWWSSYAAPGSVCSLSHAVNSL